MTCGCGGGSTSGTRSRPADRVLRGNALACWSCPHAVTATPPPGVRGWWRRCGWKLAQGGAWCKPGRVDVSLVILAGLQCPARRHSDARGVTRDRWGVRWYGASFGVRLAFYIVTKRWPDVAGCGCVVVFRDAATWAENRFADVTRPTRATKP